jgi:PurA ssDNA and RNA-binding protein
MLQLIVSCCQVSMTTPLSRQRSQVAIPAQGMIEVRDALTDLLNEFGTEDQESQESNKLCHSLRLSFLTHP